MENYFVAWLNWWKPSKIEYFKVVPTPKPMEKLGIEDYQFKEAATLIDCSVSTIKAVNQVEARGSGFLANGNIKILFEPHIFYRQLKAKGITPGIAQAPLSDILYKDWKRGAYGSENAQHSRLERAKLINEEAALLSASYGAFQIMGFNYKLCNYKSVFEMVAEFEKAEYYQLMGFVRYVISVGLAGYLKYKNFAKFAAGYNGPGYKGSPYTVLDDYDYKLAQAEKLFFTK